MSAKSGKIMWFDLTVEHTEVVRDFYAQVVDWKPEPVEMDDYADFNMQAGDGEVAAGICHKRGDNQHQPAQWMIYITVENLEQSLIVCVAQGGKVVVPTRDAGTSRFAVIQDPAGAVCTLFQQGD